MDRLKLRMCIHCQTFGACMSSFNPLMVLITQRPSANETRRLIITAKNIRKHVQRAYLSHCSLSWNLVFTGRFLNLLSIGVHRRGPRLSNGVTVFDVLSGKWARSGFPASLIHFRFQPLLYFLEAREPWTDRTGSIGRKW